MPMTNMGLIDHQLTPKIVAWLEAVNRRAAYYSQENHTAEITARELLNAALKEYDQEIASLNNHLDAAYEAAGLSKSSSKPLAYHIQEILKRKNDHE